MADPTKVGNSKQYTQVAGIRAVRRLPRLGKIRLGQKHPEKGYPMDLDYFKVPDEVAARYGERPRELDVMLPVDDPAQLFPYALKWYSATMLICKGDGVTANRLKTKVEEADEVIEDVPGKTTRIKCPCPHLKTDENPKGECTLKGTLMVMLPSVSVGGVYAIDTSSINNVIEINSAIAREDSEAGEPAGFLRAMFGRVALIPLKLRRVEREIIRPTDNKKTKKWLLQLTVDMGVHEVQAFRDGAVLALQRSSNLALPPPDKDIQDDSVPIDVQDLEDGPAEEAPPQGTLPPSSEGGGEGASETGDPPPPAQEEEDVGEALEEPPAEEKKKESDAMTVARGYLAGATSSKELGQRWSEVVSNKSISGKEKAVLQDEVLLPRKKDLQRGKK